VTALFGGGDERFILGVSGLTNVIVGVLALTWPAVTVLVLAVIFGLRMIVLGIGQIVLGFKIRPHNAKYIRGLAVRRIVTDAIDPRRPEGLAAAVAQHFDVDLRRPHRRPSRA
jgi:hypothetical protein